MVKTKKALVVIDVQKYFIDDKTKTLPKKIASYIKKNKDSFDKIYFFRFVNNENTPFYNYYNWKEMMDSPETDFSPKIEEVLHFGATFNKSTRSCLRNEEFRRILKGNKIGELYLCGLNTEECIMATGFDGFDCGFKIFVLEKLCSSHYGQQNHKKAIELMKNHFEVI